MDRKITHSKQDWADYYSGTKEALIAAKICKAAWFPAELERIAFGNGTRTKRTYQVAGQVPAVVLTHRKDVQGEFWDVRICVSEEEQECREAASRKERATQHKRCEEAQQERLQADEAARPLVEKLRRKYPGIGVEGCVWATDEGVRQTIHFQSRSLDDLQDAGLVTEKMLRLKGSGFSRDRRGRLENGDRFSLHRSSYSGTWELYIYTDSAPDEKKAVALAEAKRVLNRIAARA